jgi:hypothetical protein
MGQDTAELKEKYKKMLCLMVDKAWESPQIVCLGDDLIVELYRDGDELHWRHVMDREE